MTKSLLLGKAFLLALLVARVVSDESDIENVFSNGIFSAHDQNEDGILSKRELKDVIRTLNKTRSASIPIARKSIKKACNVAFSPEETEANSTSLLNQCISTGELLRLYNYSGVSIDAVRFGHLLPSFVYQSAVLGCSQPTQRNDTEHNRPSSAEVWGYGMGFVTLIVLISNVGAFMIPVMHKTYYKQVVMFMVALAVGSMTGTSVFVLMPEAYNLKNIRKTEHDYTGKATMIMIAVYAFFVMEQIVVIISHARMRAREHKCKHIDETDINGQLIHLGDVLACEPETCAPAPSYGETPSKPLQHGHAHFESGEEPTIATVAWMVLTSDSLHNLMDGLAIGAGFTKSVPLGVVIAISCVFEELPHELGDVAILVHSGLTMKRALLYNCLAATTVYIGLIIGIEVGKNTDANRWIFALTAGMFLYIALVDMLPEVNKVADTPEGRAAGPLRLFVIQNSGMLLGAFLIVAVALVGKLLK